MIHFLPAFRVLHGEVKTGLVDARCFYAPTLRGIREGLLQFDELCEVVVVERVGLAKVTAGVKLVESDLACRRTLLEE